MRSRSSSDASGTENVVVTKIADSYSPGISPVLLRAPVAAVEASAAVMTVGSVSVDYSSTLSVSPSYEPPVGQIIEVAGTQPAIGSVILVGDGTPTEI